MRIKNTLLATVAALILAPAAAFAAEQDSLQVEVKAKVPSANGLLITPVGDWTNTPQTMSWERVTETLNPISQAILIRSQTKVSAYLLDAPTLSDAAAGTLLPLEVHIGGKKLDVGSAAKVDVATAAEGAANTRKATAISAPKPVDGFVQGNYTGLITLMFENETTTP